MPHLLLLYYYRSCFIVVVKKGNVAFFCNFNFSLYFDDVNGVYVCVYVVIYWMEDNFIETMFPLCNEL